MILGSVDATTWTLRSALNLKSPSSGATSISALKGTIKLTLAKEGKVVTISDRILSAKGATRRAHNGTLEITDVIRVPRGNSPEPRLFYPQC